LARVGVIIPVYNVEQYLSESIESILNQTFSDFTLYLVNDGSTDGSEAIIKSYQSKDSRVVYLNKEINSGVSETMNLGLKHCTEPYIARMDSDDISMLSRLEEQVHFLDNNPDIDVVGSHMELFGEEIGVVEQRFPTQHEEICLGLFFSGIFPNAPTMFRRHLYDSGNFVFNNNHMFAEDYDLWYRLKDKARYALIDKVLYRYRRDHLNTIGFSLTEQELTLHTFDFKYGLIAIESKSIEAYYHYLNRVKVYMIDNNYISDKGLIQKFIREKWSKSFFTLADQRKVGLVLKYWRLSRGVKFRELRYFLSKLLRK